MKTGYIILWAAAALAPYLSFAASAANTYVTVESSTTGVEGIYAVGDDFYVTTRGVCSPPFAAEIEITANSPWHLKESTSRRLRLAIGESGEYRVDDGSGVEEGPKGDIYVLKLDIEQSEINVCWKSTSCTLNLTDDSYTGGGVEWTSGPTGISGRGRAITFNPSLLDPGEYVVTARTDVVKAYFDTRIVRVVASRLIIYVDQPGTGGDRDPYEVVFVSTGRKKVEDVNVDVGHTFWAYTCTHQDAVKDEQLRQYANQPTGFYPIDSVSPSNPSQPGELIIPDNTHMAAHEVEHKWDISLYDLQNGLRYSKDLHDNPGTYNLNSNNCTDAAIDAAAAVGISINTQQGTWPGGGGRNPGDLGEDLKELAN